MLAQASEADNQGWRTVSDLLQEAPNQLAFKLPAGAEVRLGLVSFKEVKTNTLDPSHTDSSTEPISI